MITKTRIMKKTFLLTCFSLAAFALSAQQNATSPTNVKQATPVVKVDSKPIVNSNTITTEPKTCCKKGAEQSKQCCSDKKNAKNGKKNTTPCSHQLEEKE